MRRRKKKSKKKKKVKKRTECGKCVRNCSVLSEMQAGVVPSPLGQHYGDR
jgi:hypothetical protein